MAIRSLSAALVLIGLGASGASAADISSTDLEAFRTAVHDAGCMLKTEADAHAIEQATGFSAEKLAQITGMMIANGEASVLTVAGNKHLTLNTGACAQ
ncbi:MAG: hypothetical protein CSA65_05585 [Proteobacteria bacterium]|nr:MAG: hypothetical protein CSA65_05585 [Pseudomonadota bacterium]